MGAVVVTSTVAVAVIAGAAVLERADEAPALAMGAVRVGGAGEREASLALVAVLGEKEKVAPALAGGQCVWAAQEREASLALVAV